MLRPSCIGTWMTSSIRFEVMIITFADCSAPRSQPVVFAHNCSMTRFLLAGRPGAAATIFACFAFLASPTAGQTISSAEIQISTERQTPHFRHLTVADGLPENSGFSLLQDRQGFLWIGTNNGLVRYDGTDAKVYQHDPEDSTSIVGNSVWGMYEDRDGVIFAGTMTGMSILDRDTDTFTSFYPDSTNPASVASADISTFFEDSRGNFWVSGFGEGAYPGRLQLFDKQSNSFIKTYAADSTVAGSISNSIVTSIVEDKDGILWLGTYGGGLNRYDWQTDTFTSYQHVPGDNTSLSNDKISKVFIDRYGTIWVGAGDTFGQEPGGALNRFDPETETFQRYLEKTSGHGDQRSNSIIAITEDASGTLWVGAVEAGVSRYDREKDTFSNYVHDDADPESIAGSSIQTLLTDRSGVLWAGSWGDGISSLSASSNRFPVYTHDPSNPNSLARGDVMTILEDRNGILWIGTDSGGLTRFDRRADQFTRFVPDGNPNSPRTVSHPFIRVLYEDSEGIIWIGTFGNGLDRYDPRTNRFSHFRPDSNDPTSINHGSVRALLEDSRGNLWVGTWGGGLNRMDRKTGRFTAYSRDGAALAAVGDQISNIAEDDSGRLLVTFNNVDSLYVIDPESGKFHSPSNNLRSGGRVFVDSRNRIWRAGLRGLLRLNDDLTFQESYAVEDGLLSSVVFSAVEASDGSLWLATDRGLARFNPDDGSIRNYTETSGLRVTRFMSLAEFSSPSGELFFGGRGGFHAFFPDRLVDNPTPPPVVITQLRINKEPAEISATGPLVAEISQTTSIKLPYNQNDLSFTFAALHFENPKFNQYRYRLEGYDDEWVDNGTNRTATYTNLSPGKYTMRVLAANSDGVWNEEGTSLAIRITPPWWATNVAYGFYLLCLVGAVTGAFRVQRSRLLAKERERSRIEQVELRAVAAESQSRLLKNENERKRNIELLSEIGRTITSSLSIDQIIETAYENVNALMDATIFGIGVRNDIAGTIDFPASKEKGVTLQLFSHNLNDPNRLSVQCLEERKEIVIHDYANEYQKYVELDLPPVAGDAAASIVYLPLVLKDKPIGVLTAQSFSVDAYSEYQLNFLRSLASYTAIAIDNADAYRRLSSTVHELQSAQAQLVHQEKLASLGELTAGIAHEIKNPLNFVNNFAEIGLELCAELREDLANGEDVSDLLNDLEQGARQIADHGKRADGIVRSMMMHAAGGSGEFQQTELNGFVTEFTDLAYHGKRALLPDFSVDISTEFDPAVSTVDVVQQDMGRVIVNLVGNAFDAVYERSQSVEGFHPRVVVSTALKGNWVEITVADNGPGVPSAIKEKVFNPFFTTKPPGSGTGLGLSMSFDIVTQTHGGHLTVEDAADGSGTMFKITIPVRHIPA